MTDEELRVLTEFCAGRDLLQWVSGLCEARFPTESVLPLAVSLLQALKYLHLKRIKPANILVTPAACQSSPTLASAAR